MQTSTELVPIIDSQAQTMALSRFAERVGEYATASRADSTLRGYKSDWRDFEGWCAGLGLSPLPAAPATVASYLTSVADRGLKAGSVQRRIASIAANHSAAEFDSPTKTTLVRLTLAGIRRKLGTRQEGKAALITSDLACLVAQTPRSLTGIRDRALLLFGFAGAFRRSELVALNVEDFEFTQDGVRVLIRKSKTDQEGSGQTIGIAYGGALCPVRALRGWLDASGISSGAVFRRIRRYGRVDSARLTDHAVAVIVKRYAGIAGLDAAKFSGHSLRSGLVTTAVMNNLPDSAIMDQTRHRSADMLRKYTRKVNVFRNNVSAGVGL